MESRLHGLFAEAEELCHFVAAESFEVAKDEHLAVDGRECGDGRVDGVDQLPASESVLGIGFDAGRERVGVAFELTETSSLAENGPQQAKAPTLHRLEQPARDGARLTKISQRATQRDERFLNGVVDVAIAANSQAVAIDAIMVLPNQLGERTRISGAGGVEECLVWRGHEVFRCIGQVDSPKSE
jgi:hypothetical protein